MYEYQVIEGESSSIDPQILNRMAQRGWRLVAVVAPGRRFYCYFERIVSQELEVDKDTQGIPAQHGLKCPVCKHPVKDDELIPMSVADMLSKLIAFAGEHNDGGRIAMEQTDYGTWVREQNRKFEEWCEANKEDIARRVVEFKRAYDKIVEEYRLRIDGDGSGTWGLQDIDHKTGWVADFQEWG